MSRKYNNGRSGKKARGVGSCGMRKHRTGGKSQVNRFERELTAREKNAKDQDHHRKRRARRDMHPTVQEAMKHR